MKEPGIRGRTMNAFEVTPMMLDRRRWRNIPWCGLAIGGLLACTSGIVYADNTADQALMVVAQVGKLDAVKRLLAEGANIETTDQHGRSVLAVATAFG